MMQILDNSKEQQIVPLFRLGFRPFFLFGVLASIATLVIWLATLGGTIQFHPVGGALWWHAHEMLFGFAGAIIVGFVLTAIQNWTGMPGVRGWQLFFLFNLWLMGRIFIATSSESNFWLAAIIELSWMPLAALYLAIPILKIKQWRNLFFVPLLLVFTLLNATMLAAMYQGDGELSQNAALATTLLIVFLISVMGGRVIPFFTAKGTDTEKALPKLWLELLCNLPILLLALLSFAPENQSMLLVKGGLALISSLANLIKLLRWKTWITFKTPLLWSLHLSYLFIPLGLAAMAASFSQEKLQLSLAIHLLTIGVIGGVILAMIARVTLGHTGRMLKPNRLMSLAFFSILAAALTRTLLPYLAPELLLTAYQISGGLWVLSFGLFVLFYLPMLTKPRLDGRPG